MKKNFIQFYQLSLKNFFEAAINLFIFLPYFFSITTLFKTLFSPWKNLVAVKKTRAFSFSEWLERFSFNLISRMIGLLMRLSISGFFLLLLMFYVLILPFNFLIYLFLIPFLYFKYSLEKTASEKETIFREKFIKEHLLKQENCDLVNQWFNHYYAYLHFRQKWWKLSNLLSIPPLARDWAVGYTPLLDQYVDDLTSTNYQNHIKSAYDREKEIGQIERTLSKSEEANVIIVGEEGVGKHTVVDSLAKRIYEGKVNNLLAYKRVLKLNLEKVLNQSTDQKQRENLLETLLKEATEAKNVILLIENFDKFVSTAVNRVDLTIPIEKYSKTNGLQIIAISQPFFYQKFIYANEKINRLFEKVDVYEIKKDEAEKLLLEKVFDFEQKYKLKIPYETVKAIIDKSDFFITHIPFPEKAIVLLDSVCVLAHENKLIQAGPDIVDKVLSEITHVPTSLTDQMKDKLVNLENNLSSMIIQQEEAVSKLSSALRRAFLLIGKRKKPLACFLFLGPTGTGKTETAKAISKLFFGSEKYLIRFDMSLYQLKNDIPNLIGSLESGNPGLLTVAIRENPYGVLLLDEIEKADKDLINIFLTVLDEGYFTDGSGKRIDCKNLVIIATSNAASSEIYKKMGVAEEGLPIPLRPSDFEGQAAQAGLPAEALAKAGGNPKQAPSEFLISYLIEQKIFSPEFLNRFDGVIVYQPLTIQSITKIAKKYLSQTSEDIYKLHRVKINVSDQLLSQIVQKGYDPKFGARNLQRVIREEIDDRIAKIILAGKVKESEIINL